MSKRDRVKVQAALAMLHDSGQDTGEVTRVAEILINSGTPTRKAYETAFNKYVEKVPSMTAPLQRVGQLIDASDIPTISRYSVALTQYIETGDKAHMAAIQPMLTRDLRAMAERTGDAGFAEGLPDPEPGGPAAAQPSATEEPSRPGWGPMGYSRSEAAPSADGTT